MSAIWDWLDADRISVANVLFFALGVWLARRWHAWRKTKDRRLPR